MNKNWRLLDTGKRDAATNMAIDEAILLQQGSQPQPTLRFYDWNQPSFSFGYFQHVASQLDTYRCADEEVELVRRITGGGIVIHGWDLTYSIIAPRDTVLIRADLSSSYRWIADCLFAAFHQLRIPAERYGSKAKPIAGGANTCLTNAAENDMMLNGRKIAGVSQRRNRFAAMYQGYIAVRMPPRHILALTSHGTNSESEFLRKSTAINSDSMPPIERSELVQSVIFGFETVSQINLISAELSAAEIRTAEILARSKYATRDWTLRQ